MLSRKMAPNLTAHAFKSRRDRHKFVYFVGERTVIYEICGLMWPLNFTAKQFLILVGAPMKLAKCLGNF